MTNECRESLLSRRRFLKWSGVTAAGALAAGATNITLADALAAAATDPLPPGTPILVVVTLYGGNDGLSMVVPYADAAYKQARPDLAIPESDVIPLGEGFGLNPGMSALLPLWQANQMAIVRGVGYPRPDHSHFTSMAIWQTGARDGSVRSGWLGRWLDQQNFSPLDAVNIGATMPVMLAGETSAACALPFGGLVVPRNRLGVQCQQLSGVDETGTPIALNEAFADAPLQRRAAQSLGDIFALGTTIETALASPYQPPNDDATAGGGNAGGESDIARQMFLAAQLIRAGVPTRVWSVAQGGFDTHADERGSQTLLLTNLANAISGFFAGLAGSPRANDVTVLVYSEFGRRVQANASDGTDHGTSGPVLLLGPNVRGGFHREQPSLTQLDKGDLAVTTDFRDIYATLLEGVLGTPADQVLGTWAGRVPLLTE